MIKRELAIQVKDTAKQFPVVSVLGPRQSGKTTMVKDLFKKYVYISLENPDNKSLAISDPHHFLEINKNDHGIILDEVQNTPELFSYIQTYVDEHKKPGYFVLTGSHNILLNKAISQTLAGRVAIFTLLPLSITEMSKAKLLSSNIDKTMFTGLYPRIFDENLSPQKWYKNYIKTYIERDVRTLKSISDLNSFQLFIKLCAGRIGQILNLTSLGNDCGITTNTAKAWLSILETSYIVFQLRPHYKNFSKRLIKSPKIYFYDTGLACSLLQIDDARHLATHYLRGNLFESFVISEFMKNRYNKDIDPNLYFWRDRQGHEVDCILEKGEQLTSVEIKINKTINTHFFDELRYFNQLSSTPAKKSFVIYGGKEKHMLKGIKAVGWQELNSVF